MIQHMFENSVRMAIFSKIKTDNPVIDTFISTIILICISYIVKVIFESDYKLTNFIAPLTQLFYKKNIIIMEGTTYSSCNSYSSPLISSEFGDNFKAVWKKIINEIDSNTTIYEIKDIYSNNSDNIDIHNSDNIKNDMYVVSQQKEFIFNKELQIYAITKLTFDISQNDSSKTNKNNNTNTNTIEIKLYSYVSSLHTIKKYIDDLTDKYRQSIETKRSTQKFIYTLMTTTYESTKYVCWRESVINNSRTFNNIFFENKHEVINKINFFINNKKWYATKGIPYTLGFGLHGVPGTGKTSFIKALANYTNRNIVILSFKLIKTKKQLSDFFFENTYNSLNKKNCIGFSDKIIVIEDIDAQGDIVMERSNKHNINIFENITEKSNVGDVIKNIIDHDKHAEHKIISTCLAPIQEDKITLDDILNLWDGIEEHSGRIMVISSNHYAKLDSALTRPGRIDITIEMKKVSHNIIKEMYEYLYEEEINVELLYKIKEYHFSPAEIVNMFLLYKNDKDIFMNTLIELSNKT